MKRVLLLIEIDHLCKSRRAVGTDRVRSVLLEDSMSENHLSCARCGGEVPQESRFCPHCGTAMPAFQTGQVVNEKYEVISRLADGGMSEVYKVRHIHLDEIRIIKVMRSAASADQDQLKRFRDEAKLATIIRHPNVATLHDFDRLPDGSYYMVWEFLAGVSIQQWMIKHGAMRPVDAINIAQQVLYGLEAIHDAGVVHRDISPDNIMLLGASADEKTDLSGVMVKVIDLGIAKRLELTASGLKTETGTFLGKAKYASPEQAGLLAPGESIDRRSDLYSLGVTLYEMLAGRAPFQSGSSDGYLAKHIHEQPATVSVTTGTDFPEGLEDVLRRALEKNREQRFDSAADFRAALEAVRPSLQDLTPAAVSAAASPAADVNLLERTEVVPLPPRSSIQAEANPASPAHATPNLRAPSGPTTAAAVTAAQSTNHVKSRSAPPWWIFLMVIAAAVGLWAFLRPRSEPERQKPASTVLSNSRTGSGVEQAKKRELETVEEGTVEASDAPSEFAVREEEVEPARTKPAEVRDAEVREARSNGLLSASEASARLLAFIRSRDYYDLQPGCLTTGSPIFRNVGYTITVITRRCEEQSEEGRIVGNWRVDAKSGEIFVRNRSARYVRP